MSGFVAPLPPESHMQSGFSLYRALCLCCGTCSGCGRSVRKIHFCAMWELRNKSTLLFAIPAAFSRSH